jgi:hypothetical protein
MGKHRRSRASLRKRRVVTRHGRATGGWRRRTVLMTAALGGVGTFVTASPFSAPATAEATEMTVEPAYGAGLFDVDPEQAAVNQDPNSVVNGDLSMFPEDWEF